LKCIPGEYLMMLVERMPRVYTAVIKSYYMISCVLFHGVDVFTIILQCRKLFKKKKERITL
jgi:hypothetical protein